MQGILLIVPSQLISRIHGGIRDVHYAKLTWYRDMLALYFRSS
jgi:hypothetical protein